MNERDKQIVEHLDELSERAAERLGDDPGSHGPVAEQIAQVRSLVERGGSERAQTQAAARSLEQRLLAWESEHPQLTTLAAQIVRALENAGL